MTTTGTSTPTPVENEPASDDLNYAIRDYVRTYVRWHGRRKTMETFGVSRYTLWRFLDRGHMGRALPRAVIETIGDNPDAIAAAAWAMTASRQIQRRAANPKPLAETLEDTLRLLYAAPLSTTEELSSFGRVPATTLRRGLVKLAGRGLADSIPHHLGAWGQIPSAATFPRNGASKPPPGSSTARNASSASTLFPGSGSGCSRTAWTPWPCCTTWPP